jgi:hypothetical protein
MSGQDQSIESIAGLFPPEAKRNSVKSAQIELNDDSEDKENLSFGEKRAPSIHPSHVEQQSVDRLSHSFHKLKVSKRHGADPA